jgi:hypothetical protein
MKICAMYATVHCVRPLRRPAHPMRGFQRPLLRHELGVRLGMELYQLSREPPRMN